MYKKRERCYVKVRMMIAEALYELNWTGGNWMGVDDDLRVFEGVWWLVLGASSPVTSGLLGTPDVLRPYQKVLQP